LSLKKNLLFLCGHYKGIDHRVREKLITRELSIGDFVLTGGELAAAVVVDAIVRLLPGVIGDGESLLDDSFQDGMLGCPSYTKPAEFRGMKVPAVLLSGNHRAISEWRQQQRMLRTRLNRKSLN
jgi:tRNA (guanine37-N1)-methyltransferase